MAFPVRQVVEPAVLKGQPNGKLPASILVDTPGQAGGPTVRLVAPAARAWRALCAAALKDGHTLKATSLADSYRPYAIQESIFRQRYSTTRPAGSPGSKVWNGVTWYQKPGTAMAAVPGTSNHGRGLAVDTGEESDGDTGTESLDDATLAWLLAHELDYGFSHEVPSERWHLRYWSGDTIPAAVLSFEASAHPTPTPSEEDDMAAVKIIWFKDPADPKGYHPYRIGADDITGVYIPGPSYDLEVNLHKLGGGTITQLGADVKGFGEDWRKRYALLDGPCINVGDTAGVHAHIDLVHADLAAKAGTPIDEAKVAADLAKMLPAVVTAAVKDSQAAVIAAIKAQPAEFVAALKDALST